ncbi:MAG TPA: hypothetical protein VN541_03070 [Tepidisphaeraceae bacterium]|nr:hypothetical protein [Tepidisphaeraceae bacterium]
MASQRSKKPESSQSKSSSGARPGGSASNASSKRHSGSNRNPDHGPSRKQPGRAAKSESRNASSARASNGSKSRRRESSPSQSAGMMDRMTDTAKDASNKAIDSVKQHPVSAAMIGAGVAGLGLLAAKLVKDWAGSGEEGQEQPQDRAGEEDRGEQSEQLEDPGPEEGDESYEPQAFGGDEGEEQQSEDEGGDEEAGGLMGRARDAWGAVRDGASSVGQSVEQGYEYGKDKLGTIWEDHPLAVSASLLALGVAAGMLIPTSRAEKKILGRTSGKLTDKIRTTSRELIEQGSELAGRVISETGTAIRDEAEREGLSPDKLARKVKRIAGRIKDVISDAASE